MLAVLGTLKQSAVTDSMIATDLLSVKEILLITDCAEPANSPDTKLEEYRANTSVSVHVYKNVSRHAWRNA